MKRLFPLTSLLLLLICNTKPAFAQEEFIEPPAKLLTRFTFKQLYGGVVILRGTFSSFADSLNFVLDTGSGGISLDSSTAEYFKLVKVPSDKTIRGIAGMRQVSFIYNQQLHLPGLTVDSLNFHINDYEILTNVYGERIDGIIGYSVLNRYIVKLDYDSSIISFYSKGYMRYPKGGYLLRPLISTLPVQTARVRDDASITSRFLFDMGAGLCLMLTNDFVKDSALMHKKRKYFVKEAEGLGGKVDMLTSVVREFRLGPYRFRNVPVYIFDDTYNVTSYPFLGGILGNDLLRRFNVILNYGRRDIYITPNSHFNDLFDYAYSGIELYSLDGLIVIGDVAKGSPAEKAGLIEGDIVVGINRTFDQNLSHYKSALQVAGERVKIVVRRFGELLDFEFKVKSIL
ncbi:MAG: aspartyl protease family protein [Chitinophagaceae bacterium]|nr:aspartyl protease family protein [Chitinophagaceae bacterium]